MPCCAVDEQVHQVPRAEHGDHRRDEEHEHSRSDHHASNPHRIRNGVCGKITEQDIHDIVDFPKHYRVDCIAASFIRKASDIDNIRTVLGPELQHIQIIAKIENQEGLQNYEEILEKVDGIMVARGDLGMEMAPEKVFLAQKYMLHEAALKGRFTITATQMLDSMIRKPR